MSLPFEKKAVKGGDSESVDGQRLVGDTLSKQRKPASAAIIVNEQELHTSLAGLKGLKARVIYPGHWKPFTFDELAAII